MRSWWRELFQPSGPPVPPLRFGARVTITQGFYAGVEGIVLATKRIERQTGSARFSVDVYRVGMTVPCVGGAEGHVRHELSVEEWFERGQMELVS